MLLFLRVWETAEAYHGVLKKDLDHHILRYDLDHHILRYDFWNWTYYCDWLFGLSFSVFPVSFCNHFRQTENDNHQNTTRAMETTPHRQSVVPLTEVFCFSESPPHLKIHSYRAAVQYVLTEMWPGFQHPTTRLVVKKGAEVPFPQYVSLVLVYLPCLSLSPLS